MKLPKKNSITQTNGKSVKWLTDDGEIFASDGTVLYKTTDWGLGWQEVYNFPDRIRQVRKLDDDSLIVALSSAAIYKSVNTTEFNEVYRWTGNGVYSDFGFDTYDRIVLASMYGTDATTAYISNDYGNEGSWRELFKVPNPNVNHIHDVKYDPYEGLIWISVGDRRNSDRLYWSDDYGRNWDTLRGLERARITSIMPFPDRVLFGSDEFNEMCVFIHERPKNGVTMGTKVELKKWVNKRNFPGSSMYWATVPAVVYGDNAKAFYGFRQSPTNTNAPSIVWETDGTKHRPIWVEEKLPILNDASHKNCGIMGIYGPDSDGNIAVNLRTNYNNQDYHLLKIVTGI